MTFDNLHEHGRMSWTSESTPFSFPVFVVYRAMPDRSRKGRAFTDTRGLNALIQANICPLPFRSDLISSLHQCCGLRKALLLAARSLMVAFPMRHTSQHVCYRPWTDHEQLHRRFGICSWVRQYVFSKNMTLCHSRSLLRIELPPSSESWKEVELISELPFRIIVAAYKIEESRDSERENYVSSTLTRGSGLTKILRSCRHSGGPCLWVPLQGAYCCTS